MRSIKRCCLFPLLMILNLTFLALHIEARKRKTETKSDYYDYGEDDEYAIEKQDTVDRNGGSTYGGGNDIDILAPLILLAPLAGAAALYTAAAVNANSALITIGFLNTRKRRSIPEEVGPLYPQLDFLSKVHVNATDVIHKMMRDYLERVQITSIPGCLERVGCEIVIRETSDAAKNHSQKVSMMQVWEQLMMNPYMGEEEKELLQIGAYAGLKYQQCLRFKCQT